MLQQISSQGHCAIIYLFHIIFKVLLLSSRFFGKNFDSPRIPSLESCVADFYFNSVVATTLYADTNATKCWFGDSGTSDGNIDLTGDIWVVHIKSGRVHQKYLVY